MIEAETTLFVLLVILTLGLILPEIFKKLHLPFITILIILGAIFGPYGLALVESNEIIQFLGFLGMTFLMLMAGIETDLKKIKKFRYKVIVMAALNGLIPFIVGVLITRYFGYSWTASILIGVVFISSSVAIIAPTLSSAKLLNKKIGQLILSSILIADIVSLVALGFIFQNVSPITRLPLSLYYPLLICSLILLFILIPKISKFAIKKLSTDMGYERQLRFVVIVTIGTLVYFSLLGVHPILAAFLVGLSLSGIIHKDKTKIIYSKVHTLGYGIFVPIFFFIVGMEMDISLFNKFDFSDMIIVSLILGLIIAKISSGYLAGRLVKLKHSESLLFGSVSVIQLTTTLAVTFAAASLGLLDNVLVTSVILLSIITTIIGPMVVSYIVRKKF